MYKALVAWFFLLGFVACQSKVDRDYDELKWIETYLPDVESSAFNIQEIKDETKRKSAIRLLDSLAADKKDSLADQMWQFSQEHSAHLRSRQLAELAIAVAEARGQYGRAGLWALRYATASGAHDQVDRLYMRAAAAFEQVGDYSNQLRCLDSAAQLSADSNVRASSRVVADLIRAGALSAEEQLEMILNKRSKSLIENQ